MGDTTSGETLSQDEVQYLRRLLNKLGSSNVASPNYVQSDLHTGKKIGSGRLHDGLYLIDGTRDSGQAFFVGNKDVNREIIQWHRRLGQPSFFALKRDQDSSMPDETSD